MKDKIKNKIKKSNRKNNLDTTKTCFSNCEKNNKNCANKKCRMWFDSKKYNNCTILASEEGSRTLQEIGDLFGLTRMRICQIEKSAIRKLKNKIETP